MIEKGVAVIGAGGKMGQGILWLVLKLALDRVVPLDASFTIPGPIVALDLSRENLDHARQYLSSQLLHYMGKRLSDLDPDSLDFKKTFALILSTLSYSSDLDDVCDCGLVFEAVFEDEGLKRDLYRQLSLQGRSDRVYLSNTSSIPISQLSQDGDLAGKVLGFHFYNPPAIQPLLELIVPDDFSSDVLDIGAVTTFAESLGKKVVCSADVAGFIGNGYFVREGLLALEQLDYFSETMGFTQALWLLNTVSQQVLLRPMGIFQVIDYVGLDVFAHILSVMDRYLDESFSSSMLAHLLEKGCKGGQRDGQQLSGFFQYDRRRIKAVFSGRPHGYVLTTDLDSSVLWSETPELPSWSDLKAGGVSADTRIQAHFSWLRDCDDVGADLGRLMLDSAKAISQGLLDDRVASSASDIETVMRLGFGHLYSPFAWQRTHV